MRFTKMQGLGNDYVYVNCFEEKVESPSLTAKIISDRHYGIGADGLILICPSGKADCRMEMYNADGSRGAMCGNGIRCVGKYVYEHGMVKKSRMRIETDSGIRTLSCRVRDGRVRLVDVEMGIPAVGKRESLSMGDEIFSFTPVHMGNPHAVLFCEDVSSVQIEKTGAFLERHERFPDRTNVEFVQVLDASSIRLRVWERGAGETLACGTGACAACAAAMAAGAVKRRAAAHLPGGRLEISWRGPGTPMVMTGPAEEVFWGEIMPEDLTLPDSCG